MSYSTQCGDADTGDLTTQVCGGNVCVCVCVCVCVSLINPLTVAGHDRGPLE